MAVVAASLMTLRPGAYEAFLEEHKKMKPPSKLPVRGTFALWARSGAQAGVLAGGELRVR